MDEQEYKDTYNRINQLKCVFEKAMCSLKCNCSQGSMFRLADRHGFGCHSPVDQRSCAQFLDHLRAQTRFVFKLKDIDGPLPHNKEIRVQNGGLLGLQSLVTGDTLEQVADVSALLREVVDTWGAIDNLPYDQVMPAVMSYQARPKRRNKSSTDKPE